MDNYLTDTNTRTGTIGGTLCVLLFTLEPAQLLTTAILAAIGALVSFGVSVLCKLLLKWMTKK
ncbi:hypothetical protein BH11BAC4_BH11BAC4_22630 [soil metagenome]